MPSSYGSLLAVTAIALAAPLLVALAARIGVQLHTIDADTGAAIIAAGLITVVLFPPIALALLAREETP